MTAGWPAFPKLLSGFGRSLRPRRTRLSGSPSWLSPPGAANVVSYLCAGRRCGRAWIQPPLADIVWLLGSGQRITCWSNRRGGGAGRPQLSRLADRTFISQLVSRPRPRTGSTSRNQWCGVSFVVNEPLDVAGFSVEADRFKTSVLLVSQRTARRPLTARDARARSANRGPTRGRGLTPPNHIPA